MSDTSRFLTALLSALGSLFRQSGAARTATDAPAGRLATDTVSPGQTGESATEEVDPRALGRVTLTYAPSRDREPDPGEVVWTWVPYEENDGRGKDRPVVIVSADGRGRYLAVQLTSKPHGGDRDYVALGAGGWDSAGRPSWAKLDRVFLVHGAGMRREAASLDEARYRLVADALRSRYGWR